MKRLAFGAALFFGATAGGAAASRPPLPAAVALGPEEVLANYAGALAALPKPPALEFEYMVEQLGLRNLEQTHHVFRAGQSERDETVSVDGYVLKRPAVRILLNRTDRYDVSAIAPKPADYGFVLAGIVAGAGHDNYVFATYPKTVRPFTVTRITVDGASFLPVLLTFRATAGGTRAGGRITYAKVERYFVVREAVVDAKLSGRAVAHERIVWSKYQFPSALPPSTFAVPRPAASAGAP